MLNRARVLGLSLLIPAAIASARIGRRQAIATAGQTRQREPGAPAEGTADPHQWSHYGGSYNEQRFSPLKKISDANVKDLGLACSPTTTATRTSMVHLFMWMVSSTYPPRATSCMPSDAA